MYILYPSISNYFKIWVCKGIAFFIKNKKLRNILKKILLMCDILNCTQITTVFQKTLLLQVITKK
jgi:hypothetical protein